MLRERATLESAAAALYPLVTENGPASDAALVGLMIVVAALRREESRGGHARSDFPQHDDARNFKRDIDLAECIETTRAFAQDLVA